MRIINDIIQTRGKKKEIDIMKKSYQVFYWIKANRQETLNHIFIMANNAKEACRKCKELVLERTGRNAFRPTVNSPYPYK